MFNNTIGKKSIDFVFIFNSFFSFPLMIFILRVQGFSNVIFFSSGGFFVSKIFLYTGFVLYFTNMTENERKREK